MDFSQLRRGEIIAAVAALLLVLAVFLPAYEPTSNPNAVVEGIRHPDTASIWDVHTISRWLILAAALAPLVLLYIVARGHELSWPRGELTAVVGLTASTLNFWNGIISRPGEPSGQIGLGIGWYLAMAASIAIAVGGAIRAGESERSRKPPGVL
jgi:hypothetical protein